MRVKLLSDNQIDKIHEASINILEKIGVFIPHDEILSRFSKNGAQVDVKKRIVKIPNSLVSDSISKAGKEFSLYGRDLTEKAEFNLNSRNYNTSGGQAFWMENVGSERRYATLKDVIIATRFADQLEQITIPGAMADPHELPVNWRCVKVAFEMIKNTNKPITFWFYDRKSAKFLVDLVIKLRGDEKQAEKYPLFYPLFEPVSPLSFPFNGVDLLFETARLNMPVHIGPIAQMGMSAPMTLAGTMAQENAEILAGICITQLIREGMPICYGGICHAFDMRTVQTIFSGPEQAIFGITMTQMGKFYGFPVYINVGLTDSIHPDAQAGLECGITLSLGVGAGANIFGHFGICGMDQAASLDMLVLQAEIISYIESVNRELSFSDVDFALEIIKETQPKGTFIDKKHTRENFKKHLWFSNLLERYSFENWMKRGATNMEVRCKKRKEEILSDLKEKSFDADIVKDLENIVKKAKQDLS
jgi:trimethylamine--corrinoid protein Co-methyltransferase